MKVQRIQEEIDKLSYWDAWVTKLVCDYFGDEVILIFKDGDDDVSLQFSGCYKIDFKHSMGYVKEKSIKTFTHEQLPYFLHDIEIGEIEKEGLKLYTGKIIMPPMDLEIWCRDIKIER
ncbi:hypothetical protein [Bacillus toyonensis]|uniref:hypothetical protein n=1 Tax=Bacillus toyonensis TaxID=155322 RepID=UPI000BF1E542|nr:hypothetical protein [Bacillus toyonensis]PEK06725.1 hypothetical protein CN681_25170 [Bacillus toyonensis]PFZ72573.1 hypothetical protein COL82_26575 [Bacillus toyonensis]PGA50508.1 hypothetical protein COL86_29690 [Bacillus toyonensis]PGB40547.1 hypothetical protein COM07_08265 [Bacillus toyonensis]PGB94191.1 hypothetical protein COM19_26310 [Bacillus toyonensis]